MSGLLLCYGFEHPPRTCPPSIFQSQQEGKQGKIGNFCARIAKLTWIYYKHFLRTCLER